MEREREKMKRSQSRVPSMQILKVTFELTQQQNQARIHVPAVISVWQSLNCANKRTPRGQAFREKLQNPDIRTNRVYHKN